MKRRMVVDNEVSTFNSQIDGDSMMGAVRWSLIDTRAPARPMFRVTSWASHPDGSVIAADVAVELLTDPVYIEVTRGFHLEIHEYSVLEGRSELLRAAIARVLTSEVRDYSFGFRS